MSLSVFLAVIAAAALHAGWNALVKGGGDKTVTMAAVIFGHLPLALLALPFVPVPTPESLPYLVGSVLFHTGYQVFLIKSYRTGELTQVYPVARGSAPLIVTLISVGFLGVVLLPAQIAGILVIGLGIFGIALARQGDGLRNVGAVGLALTTGCFIAGYSIVDGLGARVMGAPVAYYSWLSLLNAVLFSIILRLTSPSAISRIPREAGRVFLIGGAASYVAYAMVVWAFTRAPIPVVTALRETSIIFALLIGILFLGERVTLAKVISTLLVVSGVIVLRIV